MVDENSKDRKLKGTEFYSTNLAADVCLLNMVADFYRPQKGSFILPKIIGIHFSFTKKIFSRLVPLTPCDQGIPKSYFTETTREMFLVKNHPSERSFLVR